MYDLVQHQDQMYSDICAEKICELTDSGQLNSETVRDLLKQMAQQIVEDNLNLRQVMTINQKLPEFMKIEEETVSKLKSEIDEMVAVAAMETQGPAIETQGPGEYQETLGNIEPIGEEPQESSFVYDGEKEEDGDKEEDIIVTARVEEDPRQEMDNQVKVKKRVHGFGVDSQFEDS